MFLVIYSLSSTSLTSTETLNLAVGNTVLIPLLAPLDWGNMPTRRDSCNRFWTFSQC